MLSKLEITEQPLGTSSSTITSFLLSTRADSRTLSPSYSGAPLQTRVAHHVVDRIAEPSFLSSVSTVGSALKSRLSALPSLFPRLIAGPPRGRGLILGLPLTSDHAVQRLVKLMRERGVLVLSCGKMTVRFVPSLVVTEEEVEKCVDTLESCLIVMNREAEGL